MDHDVIYLEIIQTGADGPILCPWLLYTFVTFFTVVPRWIFLVHILAKNRFEYETSMKPTNFSPGFVISSSDMMYTLLVFLPVAVRIEITEPNQDCNIWECCSARFQLACGSVRKRTKKMGRNMLPRTMTPIFFLRSRH